MFQRYDLNADHNLSWEEFQQWYGDNHDGPSSSSPLESAKISTGLGNFTAEDVFERLAMSANDEGYLTRDAFFELFEDFGATKKGIQMLSRVFDVFVEDIENDLADFSDVASGLTILTKGTGDEKAEQAFQLYDYDGNGYVSLDECTRFLGAVFKVMWELAPDTFRDLGVDVDPETLARVTADDIFVRADLDGDGNLSLDEFKRFYGSNTPANAAAAHRRR